MLQAIHPDWDIKKDMFGIGYDKCDNCTSGFTTENAIMRLVFHDCVRYTDGTGNSYYTPAQLFRYSAGKDDLLFHLSLFFYVLGGCDGCLNWGGVGDPHPNPNDVILIQIP